ncbi:MAG: NAD(P)H-binding protein [bacterium]
MIFIAGGTGFVGRNLLDALQGEGASVRCLVRDEKKAEWVRSLGFEAVQGDITNADSLDGALEGVEAAVHLAGIIEEKPGSTFESVHVQGTRNLVSESAASGVKRIFYQSALGADIHSPFAYLKTKAEAEKIVISSDIPYTIFRPSLIVGKGDGFTERMKQLISAGPVVPVPGDGLARFQPVYIRDWLQCFRRAFINGGDRERIYEFGGPEQLSYNEILKEIMDALEIKKSVIHIPMGVARLSLPFMGAVRSFASALGREIPPVTDELLSLLGQDNICGEDSITKNFGFTPVRFSEALREFLKGSS